MQVSSWIAARVAVLVEFAVFLISSTTIYLGFLSYSMTETPFFIFSDRSNK